MVRLTATIAATGHLRIRMLRLTIMLIYRELQGGMAYRQED